MKKGGLKAAALSPLVLRQWAERLTRVTQEAAGGIDLRAPLIINLILRKRQEAALPTGKKRRASR
jgi:hypothetical protein